MFTLKACVLIFTVTTRKVNRALDMEGLSNRTSNLLKRIGYANKRDIEMDVLSGVLALDKTNDLGRRSYEEICAWLSINPTEIIRKHSVGFRAYEEFKKSGSLNSSLDVILSPRANRLNKMHIIGFLASCSKDDMLKLHREAISLSKTNEV